MSRYGFKVFLYSMLLLCASSASADRLSIYIDADFSISLQSSEAIELGVNTALAEAGYTAGGLGFDVIRKNHRANSKRTLSNLRAFQADPQALAVIGGAHSPPYLSNQSYINENGLLVLLPWSAAGPITRPDAGQTNWIFRLSVDDTKAGPFLVARALRNPKCKRTALLLIDTGWGRVNSSSMQAAFKEAGADAPSVFMFSAGLGTAGARSMVQSIAAVRPDCVVMLAFAQEGGLLTNQLHQSLPDVKLISHWGILASDFEMDVPHSVRSGLQIEVLQTCGLRAEQKGGTALSQALATASTMANTPLQSLSDVPSSTGFVHGYDLTKLLLAAVEQAAQSPAWQGAPIAKRRDMVRLALEDLPGPVEGILKSYTHPFAVYSPANQDAHEALGLPDLCMASFSETGRLVLATQPNSAR